MVHGPQRNQSRIFISHNSVWQRTGLKSLPAPCGRQLTVINMFAGHRTHTPTDRTEHMKYPWRRWCCLFFVSCFFVSVCVFFFSARHFTDVWQCSGVDFLRRCACRQRQSFVQEKSFSLVALRRREDGFLTNECASLSRRRKFRAFASFRAGNCAVQPCARVNQKFLVIIIWIIRT